MKKKEITLNPPLAIPAVLLAFGIAVGNFIPIYYNFAFAAAIFSFILFLYCKKKNNFRKTYFLFLAIFSLGFISILPHLPKALETQQMAQYFDEKELHIFGKVDSRLEKKNIRTNFILKLYKIKKRQGHRAEDVNGRIRLYSYYNTPDLEYGDVISFKGSIKKPRNFANPGGFDYVRYLAFNNIKGVAYISGKKIKVLHQKREKNLLTDLKREINKLREEFSRFVRNTIKDDEVSSIVCALTTGIRDYIPEKLREDFSKTGASHILAISGLHLSIVAIIFFFIFNIVFSCITPLLLRGVAGKLAALATLIPLMSYALLSGFSPSTKRAFIMITIYMFSFVIEREKDVLNSLAAAGIIILVINPCALFAISFQLSFSAVLFIILGVYIIRDIPFFTKKDLVSRLSVFIIISFFAGLGTMPLIMYYFNIISFVQLFTNIVIIPALGFVVVPLSLAAFFTFPFSDTISIIFFKPLIPVLSFSISFTQYLSLLPFTWARCVTPSIFEITCYYAFISGAFLIILKRGRKGVYIIVFSVLFFICSVGFTLKQRYFSGKLQITILNVGQGNSALIEGPKGTKILVDGGGFSYNSSFDTGKHIVAPFLWNSKITSLDAVILTHPEEDHMNGLVYIIENFKVRKFIKNFDTREKKSYKDIINICLKKRIPIVEFPLEKSKERGIGELHFLFLHPVLNEKNMDKFEKNNYNNNSLVFKVRYKKFKTLFPGDIMEKTEHKLALGFPDKLKADVLIAPHHGSSTSSTSLFLDKVDPKSIIISCGWNNRYNFPDDKVIARYDARHINFYRTDLHGAVKVVSNGKSFNIVTYGGD